MELPSPSVDHPKNKKAAITLNLTEPLLHRGYTLWMDNYLNSPDMACFMKRGTNCVGTLRVNRRAVPSLVKTEKLKRGETVGQHLTDVTVLAW